MLQLTWVQLFKTNDVVSSRIVKSLIAKYGIYARIDCWKNVSSFSYFFSKNTCELDIVLTRTFNILTNN